MKLGDYVGVYFGLICQCRDTSMSTLLCPRPPGLLTKPDNKVLYDSKYITGNIWESMRAVVA